MQLIAWFAENRVAANFLAIVIAVVGFSTLPEIRKEILPNISLEHITISVSYPGASPSEIEESICQKIEAAIFDLEGIRHIRSIANEEVGTVNIEVESGYDTPTLLEKIKTRVDAIDDFPKDIEKPTIQQVTIRNPVTHVVVYGDVNSEGLKKIAEKVQNELSKLDGVSFIEPININPYEISIEVSETSLQRYGLTLAEVSDAIRRSSLDVPAGRLEAKEGDVMLETQGRVYTGEQFKNIILKAKADGGRVSVGDIAQVIDGVKTEKNILAEFNGKPAIFLAVYRVGNQSILKISDSITKYINSSPAKLPLGVKLDIWADAARHFKSRVDLLGKNAVQGLVLLTILLLIFMQWRFALWIGMGIPIAFLGALSMLPVLDASINMISMFALLLVLGIVVDDSIIIGESIFAQNQKGVYGVQAAIRGTQEVAKPVIFAALTTCITFMPILFLPGSESILLYSVPIIVLCVLFFSLLECLLILPAHLSHTPRVKKAVVEKQLQKSLRHSVFDQFVAKVYEPFLNTALTWRYTTISLFLTILIICASILASGWLRTELFPEIESEVAIAAIKFPLGTPFKTTEAAVKKIEASATSLREELRKETGREEIEKLITVVGLQPMSDTSFEGAHVGEVSLELSPAEDRTVPSAEIVERWRKLVGTIPNVQQLNFNANMRDSGPEITINVSGGESIDSLVNAIKVLKNELTALPGIYQVTDSYQAGQRQIDIKMKPSAANLGLSVGELSKQVRNAFYGEEVQKIQRGKDEVKVFVRLPEENRRSLYYLENMNIRLNDGSFVPLQDVAKINYSFGPTEIERVDRERVITLRASVNEQKIAVQGVVNRLLNHVFPKIADQYPDVHLGIAGLQGEAKEAVSVLFKGFLISAFIVYALISVLFRSYLQALIVISVIPFGLVGAILGHLILGINMTLWSFVGMVAAGGVIVNDNLVLINCINQLREAGLSLRRAVKTACVSRLRPILLTSITTFVSLVPLLLEKSIQAQYMIPMAISLAFGVLFATSVTMFFVPALFFAKKDFNFKAQTIPASLPATEQH